MADAPTAQFETATEYVKFLQNSFKAIFDQVKLNSDVKIKKFKFFHDRKVHSASYDIGDLVWLEDLTPKVGLSRKLRKKWKGPFKIIEVIKPVNYKIKPVGKGRAQIVNVIHLKRCFSKLGAHDTEETKSEQDRTELGGENNRAEDLVATQQNEEDQNTSEIISEFQFDDLSLLEIEKTEQDRSGQDMGHEEENQYLKFDDDDYMVQYDTQAVQDWSMPDLTNEHTDHENVRFQSYLKIAGDITMDETLEAGSEYEPNQYFKQKIAEETTQKRKENRPRRIVKKPDYLNYSSLGGPSKKRQK